ncbi:Xanthine dehydrogenase [Eumeta japonica]|uniref:Xanthine dehydrogenase n=1 Tax=Eumeta variegata TaxID=151549 RepID=A0A4C1WDE2_EUMVA|nr:Xanthine dehydrogenase [Eumeta japonica]
MDRIAFSVNGTACSVGSEVDSDKTLVDYIRRELNLTGTKVMCREAGCGACVVAVTAPDPLTGQLKTFSANSAKIWSAFRSSPGAGHGEDKARRMVSVESLLTKEI